MTDAQATTSLTQHVLAFDAGRQVVAAAFLGDAPALALADGVVLIGEPDAQRRVAAHPDGAILVAVSDGKTLVTGGDDGRVTAIGADGELQEIADEKGRWIDALALRGAAFAWSAGQSGQGARRGGRGQDLGRALERAGPRLPAEGLSPGGDPLQRRDALVSQGRGGAADAGMEGRASRCDLLARRPLPRHLDAGERAARLAARRFPQHADDRLSRQDALAVVVARRRMARDLGRGGVVVWPFKDKDGPMGKAPRECGVREARVTKVAFHPRALVLAIGYADGLVLLCRLADAAEILVRRPGGGAIGALAWNASGARLLFGLESGEAGLLNLPG